MVREAVDLRVAPPRPKRPFGRALLSTARPLQWSKNVLVFAAPGAAGVLSHGTPLWRTLIAFGCFCAAASGTYFLNDAADVESDRRHPTKRHRPIAAGDLGIGTARVVGVALIVIAVGASLLTRWELAATVGGYVVLTTAYSSYLKHVTVVDIVAVAGGFVLRAIAGAAATGVPISNWFFIVASFGSLFMVAGKRHAERLEMGAHAGSVRATLAEYSESYLAYLRTVSSGVTLVAYCLWAFDAFDKAQRLHHQAVPYYQLSILPFVMAILRYALLVDQGKGSAPEEIVLSDRPLQIIGLAWIAVFALGVYFG